MRNSSNLSTALMQSLSALEIKVAKLEQQVFEKNQQVRAGEELIEALRSEIEVLRDQNIAALNEVELRGQQMVALREGYERSTSWRVTQPLRWLSEQRKREHVPAADSEISASGERPGTSADDASNSPQNEVPPIQLGAPAADANADLAVADQHDYAEWVRRFDTPTEHQQAAIAEAARQTTSSIRVTLLSVVGAPLSAEFLLPGLQALLKSLTAQQHANWEWLILGPTEALEHLRTWASTEPRIRLIDAAFDATSAWGALNVGLQQASGEWLALIDDQVQLRKHALLVALDHMQAQPAARVIYADEDRLDGAGDRSDPSFLCDANLDLLKASDYLGQFVLFKREDLVAVGGWSTSLPGGHRHDLLLRVTERWHNPADAIVHVPQILSHRLAVAASKEVVNALLPCGTDAADQAPENQAAIVELVQAHLSRQGLQSTALPHPTLPGVCRVRFALPQPPPRVGIVMPTRDNVGVLSVCLESLLYESTYPDFRVVVVDNGSVKPETRAYLEAIDDPRVQVLRDDAPFNFSSLINRGASAVEGEVLCLLNNDMQITQPDWLEEMVGWALQDGVAAVGARLWYGEGTLQHGGIVLGIQGVAGHAHKHLAKDEPGYLNRAVLHQTMSAVTGACMVVRRSVFDEVGGFDEALGVAYNDVDFCLRARKAGYRNVWTPHAEMIHHESVSRGFEDSPEKQARFQREAALMRERWGDWLDNDPAYNPNLTLEHEDFGLAWPPRASVS